MKLDFKVATAATGFDRAVGVGSPERSEPEGPQGAERGPPDVAATERGPPETFSAAQGFAFWAR